jgi:hypothetical protein
MLFRDNKTKNYIIHISLCNQPLTAPPSFLKRNSLLLFSIVSKCLIRPSSEYFTYQTTPQELYRNLPLFRISQQSQEESRFSIAPLFSSTQPNIHYCLHGPLMESRLSILFFHAVILLQLTCLAPPFRILSPGPHLSMT